MNRAELEDVIIQHADPRNAWRGTSDGAVIRAALDEYTRSIQETAWDEGAESAFYAPTVRGQVDYPTNPYSREA